MNNNSNKPITTTLIKRVRQLATQNTPTRLLAYKIGRKENSVRNIATANNISPKPTNQSPYDRNYSKSKKKMRIDNILKID